MKQTSTGNSRLSSTLVKTGVLGIGALIGSATLTSSATAAPNRNRDVQAARRDVKEARKDVRQERRDVRRADTPHERREAREDLRDARQDLRRDQQDLRREKREEQRYNGSYNGTRRPNWNTRPGYNAPRYGNGYGVSSTLTGVVVREYTNDRFDLRVGGRIIMVEPRGGRDLASHDSGDLVRVYGVARGNTFIAENLSVLRNG